jgi:ATP-dependent helicase HrpB
MERCADAGAASTVDLPMTELPIDGVLPRLSSVLSTERCAVLQAPPGAGKTTRVPLALLDQPWLGARRVVMLEPRRLAARAAAAYMARLLGEQVGDTVGYRVRLDSRVGPRTRIEVVTEGVLTRMLQDDPSLDAFGVVIFDEFHERSLHADLGLALTLEMQAALRPDLRVLVMSATLDGEAIATLLGDAPIVRSEGRAHPVETIYLTARAQGHIEAAVTAAVRRAIERHDGDILVFLPGTAEIRRTAERLAADGTPRDTALMPLYGDLPQDAQDRAIEPSPPGMRKVVLATAIAETSLTIEGVRVVVDSGLMRVPRFSPRTGMTRLVTVPVSRASADQRRGRAGRLGPGVCYRLWTESEHAGLLAQRPPEIVEADLAPLALELAAWGVHDPRELRWLDPPPAAAYAQARELLRELEAIDAHGRTTAHGRDMAALPLHPRLAHMLLMARLDQARSENGAVGADTASADAAGPRGSAAARRVRLACELAAVLGERDILRAQDTTPDPDVRLRLPLVRGTARVAPHGHTLDRGALDRVRREARHLANRMSVDRPGGTRAGSDAANDAPDDDAGLLLAFAYPDRIGQRRRGRGRFLLRNGRGAAIDPGHGLAGEEFIVAAEVGGHGRDSRVFLGAPIDRSDIERHFAGQIETASEVSWDGTARVVRARDVVRLGAFTLAERPAAVPPDRIAAACLDAVRAGGLELLPWSREADALRQRLVFLHALMPDDWPDVSDAALLASLDEWLPPWIGAEPDALRRVDTAPALLAYIGPQRRGRIDQLAPTHVQVPSGSRVAIDYGDPAAPVLAVRIQEIFGLTDTPSVGGGAVPLTLHLLSPARRPVQVTRDLASFWSNAYFDVRRDLRGRYPKHYWPDDPLIAMPTRRTRPRGS